MHRVGLLLAGLVAASVSDPARGAECWDDQCEAQVELIQTSSLLERRSDSKELPAAEDVSEDYRDPAIDSLSASSFVAVASEEVRRSLIGELLSRDVEAHLQDSSLWASANSTTTTTSSSTVVSPVGNSEGDLKAFLAALGVSVGVSLLFCCFFTCCRQRYALVYAQKAETPGSHGMQPPDVTGFCSWVVESWRLPVEEVANHANLDHGMFVQFCDAATMCLLSTGIPSILILCPLHFFAGGNAAGSDNLSRVGFANVVKGSTLTWVHPFFVWYTVIVTQAFLLRAQRGFVQKRFQWLRTMPEPRANSVLLHNIPPELRQEASLKEYLEKQIFGAEGSRQVVRSLYFLKDTSELEPFLKQRHRLLQDHQRMVQASEHERRQAVLNAEVKKVDAQLLKQQAIIERSDEYNQDTAFVTFELRHDAIIVLKLFADGRGGEDLLAELPPDPDDVIWTDLLASAHLQWLGDTLGVFLLLLAFLVMIPLVAVIAGLSSEKSLEAQDPNFAAFVKNNPAVPIFWNGLLGPFSLNLVMSFLPAVLALILGSFFVLKARGWLQFRIQQWYYMFLLLLVLFVTSVGTALSSTLDYLVKNPIEIPSILAQTFPTCTHFYMNYVGLQISVHTLALTRLFVLIKFMFYRCFYEDLTALQRAEPEDQEYHGMGSRSARVTLLYVLALVFSTLCPLITLLGAVAFGVARVVYTYLFVYAETLKPDLGGLFWQRQLNHAQQGTFLYIALMTAVLLQRAPTPWPGMICASSAVFMGFSYYTFLNRFRWEQLQFSEVPSKGAMGGPPAVYGHYKQPQLPPPPPPAPKNDLLTRAVTSMRQRLDPCGFGGYDDEDVRDARQFRRSKTAAEGRASAAAAAQMEYKRTRTTTE